MNSVRSENITDREKRGAASGRARPILWADDHVLLGDGRVSLFRRAGHRPEQVRDGLEAWDRRSADIGHCDVLVTDHEMPGLKGGELVERARQAGFAGRIVVHSSSLTPDQVERYRPFAVAAIVIKLSRADERVRAVEAGLSDSGA